MFKRFVPSRVAVKFAVVTQEVGPHNSQSCVGLFHEVFLLIIELEIKQREKEKGLELGKINRKFYLADTSSWFPNSKKHAHPELLSAALLDKLRDKREKP